MIDIAAKQIIPAVIKYTTVLAQSINAVKSACGADISAQTEILTECIRSSGRRTECSRQVKGCDRESICNG